MNKSLHIKTELPADFQQLVGLIRSTSTFLQEHARSVINRDVTVRAWLTGLYIVEYEQKGNDRAQYGEQLLKKLARQLNSKGFSEKQQTPSAVLHAA